MQFIFVFVVRDNYLNIVVRSVNVNELISTAVIKFFLPTQIVVELYL